MFETYFKGVISANLIGKVERNENYIFKVLCVYKYQEFYANMKMNTV